MNIPTAANPASPPTNRKVQTDPLRQWLAVEQSERVVALAQTALGKVCLYAIAYLAALPLLSAWAAALCVAAAWAVMAYASQRVRILFIASWGLTLLEAATDDNDFAEKIQYVLA
jgi:hypothetical protein